MSRKRQVFLIITVSFAFFLQFSVMPHFKLLGCQPDLLLVVAIVVAVQEDPITGAIVGFCGGFLQDLISHQVLGVSALTKALAVFISGMLKELFMTYSMFLPAILVLLGSILEVCFHEVTLLMLGQGKVPPLRFAAFVLPTSLYNVLAAFVIYPLMRVFSFPVREERLIVRRTDSTG